MMAPSYMLSFHKCSGTFVHWNIMGSCVNGSRDGNPGKSVPKCPIPKTWYHFWNIASLLITTHIVTYHRNLKIPFPSTFSATVLSWLPLPQQFSTLSVEEAFSTLTSSFSSSSSFNLLCPLTARPVRSSPETLQEEKLEEVWLCWWSH